MAREDSSKREHQPSTRGHLINSRFLGRSDGRFEMPSTGSRVSGMLPSDGCLRETATLRRCSRMVNRQALIVSLQQYMRRLVGEQSRATNVADGSGAVRPGRAEAVTWFTLAPSDDEGRFWGAPTARLPQS